MKHKKNFKLFLIATIISYFPFAGSSFAQQVVFQTWIIGVGLQCDASEVYCTYYTTEGVCSENGSICCPNGQCCSSSQCNIIDKHFKSSQRREKLQ